MQHIFPFERGRLPIAAMVLGLCGCGETYAPDAGSVEPPASGSTESICYRGVETAAARQPDGRLIVYGDIIVRPSDQWCASDEGPSLGNSAASGTARTAQGLSVREPAGYQWPGGVVPFVIDQSLSAYDANIRAVMTDIAAKVGRGLMFREKIGSDSAWIQFVLHATDCSSPVGYAMGQQTINLIPSCIVDVQGVGVYYSVGVYHNVGVYHEIAHVLGAVHEHQRKDRDTYLTMNWGHMIGCPNNATDWTDCNPWNCWWRPAECGCTVANIQTCYVWPPQFAVLPNTQATGPIDYASAMMYNGCTAVKVGAPCPMQATQIDPSTGLPYVFGVATTLSEGDIRGLRVMYPSVKVPSVIFTPGVQTVCELDGRTEDIATQVAVYGLTNPASTSCTINTEAVGTRTRLVNVNIRSQYSARHYDYPNYTVPYDPTQPYESYSALAGIRVLNAGLIAIAL